MTEQLLKLDDPVMLGTGLKRKFFLTKAYLLGAADRADIIFRANPFKPGPGFAQYAYGFQNEGRGWHDHLDLPAADGRK